MIFKEKFVKELKLKIPENINKFNLIYPKQQIGYARFNQDRLEAIYLENLTDEYGNQILLKFKYRDFHYVSPSYIFDSIYFMKDGCNELRYNKDLKLIAKYLRNISIPSNLDKETKLHILNILIEWKNFDELEKEHISTYQIEKDGEKVKIPYIVFNDKLKNDWRFKILYNIVEEFNIENIYYFQKCEINKNKIIKKDSIYLGYKLNTNEEG